MRAIQNSKVPHTLSVSLIKRSIYTNLSCVLIFGKLTKTLLQSFIFQGDGGAPVYCSLSTGEVALYGIASSPKGCSPLDTSFNVFPIQL